MRLIVGLGNPGEKYKNNRHNVGFMFLDYLVYQLTSLRVNALKYDKYLNSQLAKLVINNNELLFSKPQTFMNLSGPAVKKLISNFKLKISNLIIVHDDLDIPLGKFKIQKGTGPQLHNGIESIEKSLRTKNFWRIRIGIDNRPAQRSFREGGIDGETYVLQNFLKEEKKIVANLFPQIFSRLKSDFSL